MAEQIRVLISDKNGKQAEVVGTPGTNFGLRLTAFTVLRLEAENGLDNLPFMVMAAGYGDDEDWNELQSYDLTGRSWTADELTQMWGPFEVTAEDFWSLPEALFGLARFVVKSSPRTEDYDSWFWVNDSETERTVSKNFGVMADAIDEADSFNADPSKAYPITPDPVAPPTMTPSQAIDRLASFIEAFSGEAGFDQSIQTSLDTLDRFVKQVDTSDLEWGEPGDCQDRIDRDIDLHAELVLLGAPTKFDTLSIETAEDEAIVDRLCRENNLGRHHGDPHCIWCLQAS